MALYNSMVQIMIPNVLDFISQHPIYNTDAASIKEWRSNCEASWKLTISEEIPVAEYIYGSTILATFLDSYENLMELVDEKKRTTVQSWSLDHRRAAIQSLLSRPQIEQRTDEWYTDALGLLSASQFSTILKTSRTRGQLVLEKAICAPIDTSNRRTVVFTDDLNPFTWGIRFEPVVKQIYQHLTNTVVVDLGRLKHPKDPRLAASPDGLIKEGPDTRLGRFVEFKAPVTRPIINKVPEEYIVQMQIQMEVGCVEECDYLEVKFNSKYKTLPFIDRPADAKYFGTIYGIGDIEGRILRYEYSPLMNDIWTPLIQENEQILDKIPWWTSTWYLTTIGRSRSWFESVQPAVESFWADVKKAKEGTFLLPESTRKRKEPVCKIIEDEQEKKVCTEVQAEICNIVQEEESKEEP